MNKPESRKYVIIDATEAKDGDHIVFEVDDALGGVLFPKGFNDLELIDFDKHKEDILEEYARKADLLPAGFLLANAKVLIDVANKCDRVLLCKSGEARYLIVVAFDHCGDCTVAPMFDNAKFCRTATTEHGGAPLTCDEFQQQMEQEKEKGMELSSDEFMKLLKERKPSDDFDDTMIDAAMEQLPHKPGLYMAQDDSIWLFDGDYFSLVREKDKSFPSSSRVYRIRMFARESVESGRFPFHDCILPDEPGYYRSADKTRLYYLDCRGGWKLVAAALTPIEQYVEEKRVCNYESAWVSENIVRKDTPLERCDHDLVSDEALRNF